MHSKKYGSFVIDNELAIWNQDNNVQFPISSTKTDYCLYEGIWNPDCNISNYNQYDKAIAGVCIWNKYDCVFVR